jgi:hypothetical protein
MTRRSGGVRLRVSKTWLILFRAVGLTMFKFGLLVWGYVVIIQPTHSEWITETFDHRGFQPLNWRVDDVGMTGFAFAPFGFLM